MAQDTSGYYSVVTYNVLQLLFKDVPLTTFVEVLKPAAECNEYNDDYIYPDYYDEDTSTCSKDGVKDIFETKRTTLLYYI